MEKDTSYETSNWFQFSAGREDRVWRKENCVLPFQEIRYYAYYRSLLECSRNPRGYIAHFLEDEFSDETEEDIALFEKTLSANIVTEWIIDLNHVMMKNLKEDFIRTTVEEVSRDVDDYEDPGAEVADRLIAASETSYLDEENTKPFNQNPFSPIVISDVYFHNTSSKAVPNQGPEKKIEVVNMEEDIDEDIDDDIVDITVIRLATKLIKTEGVKRKRVTPQKINVTSLAKATQNMKDAVAEVFNKF